jgi:hypothetical protein
MIGIHTIKFLSRFVEPPRKNENIPAPQCDREGERIQLQGPPVFRKRVFKLTARGEIFRSK